VTGDPSRAARLSGARSYLRVADPVLARLIDERQDFDPRRWMSQLPAMDLSPVPGETQSGPGRCSIDPARGG
jgi:hypothetical protein